MTRKWTYWHRVTVVDEKKPGSFIVGQLVGLGRVTKDWPSHDDDRKGFYTMAQFDYLGKLPYKMEETDPFEASRRIDAGEWA